MDKDSNLPAWIFGGLVIATLAVALVVGSTDRNTTKNLQALSQRAAEVSPVIVPRPTPVPTPAGVPTVTTPIQTVSPPMAHRDQIWECVIKGQRTFSDNPCGDHSSVREISAINRMDPTPIPRQARSYEPIPGQPEDFDPPQESADSAYPGYVGIPFYEHRRPDHRRHGHRPRADTDAMWPQPAGLHPPRSR